MKEFWRAFCFQCQDQSGIAQLQKDLIDFFQKVVGFQRATPLVDSLRHRNTFSLKKRDFSFSIPFSLSQDEKRKRNKQRIICFYVPIQGKKGLTEAFFAVAQAALLTRERTAVRRFLPFAVPLLRRKHPIAPQALPLCSTFDPYDLAFPERALARDRARRSQSVRDPAEQSARPPVPFWRS